MNSYNRGEISVSDASSLSSSHIYLQAGGIAGYLFGGNLTNSYNTEEVSIFAPSNGEPCAGGIAGYVFLGSEISGSAAINGTIAATGATIDLGRVAGINSASSGSNTITNNFATSGMLLNGTAAGDSDENGTGIPLTDFQSRDTYETNMGWEFGETGDPVWKMPEDETYPILYWQD
jgi:hypothetical protein